MILSDGTMFDLDRVVVACPFADVEFVSRHQPSPQAYRQFAEQAGMLVEASFRIDNNNDGQSTFQEYFLFGFNPKTGILENCHIDAKEFADTFGEGLMMTCSVKKNIIYGYENQYDTYSPEGFFSLISRRVLPDTLIDYGENGRACFAFDGLGRIVNLKTDSNLNALSETSVKKLGIPEYFSPHDDGYHGNVWRRKEIKISETDIAMIDHILQPQGDSFW